MTPEKIDVILKVAIIGLSLIGMSAIAACAYMTARLFDILDRLTKKDQS